MLNDPASQLRRDFTARFAAAPTVARAPGRVNLIGDHTDYNGGLVMPAALGFQSWVAAAARQDGTIFVYSAQFDETVECRLSEIRRYQPSSRAAHWADYPLGVAACLLETGVPLAGANLAIAGDVPLGAGLSSSASLEVATAGALLGMLGATLPSLQIAQLCQQAENEYVGMRCGIMDQYIAVFGQAQAALELDCRRLTHRPIPLPTGPGSRVQLIVCDSLRKHELASSGYNQRRAQCESALAALRGPLPALTTLSDLTIGDLHAHASHLDDVQFRRARHVVTENSRVRQAADALLAGRFEDVGVLMFESHDSLRDDYEVSCEELDCLVAAAREVPGTYGARMTGGGFGGCSVNLVRTDAVEAFERHVGERYQRDFGLTARMIRCETGDGLRLLRENP